MRRLDGGQLELSSVISRSLSAAFPGTEFFLDQTDDETYQIYWRHSSGPADEAVKEFMTRRWGQFECTYHESEGRTFSGPTGGVRGSTPSSAAGAPVSATPTPPSFDLSTAEGINKASALIQSLMPRKKSTVKKCPHCGTEARKSARHCAKCGLCYPSCTVCDRVLQTEEQYCPGCGIVRCSYV